MYNRFGYHRRTVTMEKQINPSMLEGMIEVKKIPIKELEGKKSPSNQAKALPDTLRNSDIMAVRTQQSMETHECSAQSKKENDVIEMKPKMNPRPVIQVMPKSSGSNMPRGEAKKRTLYQAKQTQADSG